MFEQPITEKQLWKIGKTIDEIVEKHGIKKETIVDKIKEKWGINKLEELDKINASGLIEWLLYLVNADKSDVLRELDLGSLGNLTDENTLSDETIERKKYLRVLKKCKKCGDSVIILVPNDNYWLNYLKENYVCSCGARYPDVIFEVKE